MLHPSSLSLLRLSSVALSSCCEEAHRLSEIAIDAIDDLRIYRKQVERGQLDPVAERIRHAEQRRDLNLAKLGEALTAEGYVEGDGVIVGSELYTLEPTGREMQVKLAGEWVACEAFVARHCGDAPLPGHDDEDDHDEVAERRSEYHSMVFAG